MYGDYSRIIAGLTSKSQKSFELCSLSNDETNALVKMPRYKLSSAIWRTKLPSLRRFSESLDTIIWSVFPWAQNFNGRSERKPAHGRHGSTSRVSSAIPVSTRVFSIYTLLMFILQAMIGGQRWLRSSMTELNTTALQRKKRRSSSKSLMRSKNVPLIVHPTSPLVSRQLRAQKASRSSRKRYVFFSSGITTHLT